MSNRYIDHPPTIPKYDGENGDSREHIAKFIEATSPWLADDKQGGHNLLMREFSETQIANAITWYCKLDKGPTKTGMT